MLLNRSRLAKLQLVQPLTEIRDFLRFITSSGKEFLFSTKFYHGLHIGSGEIVV